MTKANYSRWDVVTDGAARVARGTVAGFLGGMVASWVMEQYQAIESRPVNVRKAEKAEAMSKTGKRKAAKHVDGNGDDTAVKVAEAVSRKFFEHELSDSEKKIAGPTVQYGYGAVAGAVYGGLSELVPTVGVGLGIPYSTLLWLGVKEIAMPSMGFAEAPTEVPVEKHASELATHFVYGITLDISRRILRRVL